MESKDVEKGRDIFCSLCGQPLRNGSCHFCLRVFGQDLARSMTGCKKCGMEIYTIPEKVWDFGQLPDGDGVKQLIEELEYCSKCRFGIKKQGKDKELRWLSLANYIAEELRSGRLTVEVLDTINLPMGFRRYCREVGAR